jgi:hypothetical protein
MKRPLLRFALAAACAIPLTLTAAVDARAFCGFYVSGADTKLQNDATQVVMMRKGTRTVLAMQNDYKGPTKDFAMVVPVPIVLQKENVKTLPREVFDKVDKLAAPRLVEYWEQDPCAPEMVTDGLGLSGVGFGGGGRGSGIGLGSMGGVTVEAQFTVGEYDIVILSAKDSSGLDTWLRANGYKIPDKAEEALRPYVQAGSKFFVAKVDASKVTMKDGRAELSPLRFHYDSEKFELPVRLGMLNSGGTQDLVVHVLAPNQRYEVANYPNVTIPTNLDVAEPARESFGAFYAALFDRTLEKHPGAVVTEYAWGATSCDPCPGNVQGLSGADVETLGGDVIDGAPPSATPGAPANAPLAPKVTMDGVTVTGGLPQEVVRRVLRRELGRKRYCYEKELRKNPKLAGTIVTTIVIDKDGKVTSAKRSGGSLTDPAVAACIDLARARAFPAPQGAAPVTVTESITFSPTGGATMGNIGFGGRGGSMVLTRMHVRYPANALGADLVFREAKPIAGGREVRAKDGSLEHGSVSGDANNFQGRYAIRHAWPGKISCDNPQRGVWGGPWPDAGVARAETKAATKTAYAARGGATLASFVPGGVPDLDVLPGAGAAASAAAPAASAGDATSGAPAPPPRGSRCGCEVVGARSGGLGGALAVLFVGLAGARRRRADASRG